MNPKKIKDLLVQLHYAFPKDVYLLENGWLIGGENSFQNSYGTIIGMLTPSWHDSMKEFISGNIFIPDIETLKKAVVENVPIDTLYRKVDGKELGLIHTTVEDHLKITDAITDWKFCKDLPDFEKTLLTDKAIYSLEIEGTDEKIEVGKPTFPICTVKTLSKYKYFITRYENMDLYHLYIQFDYTHYQLWMYYSAIPMKNIQ